MLSPADCRRWLQNNEITTLPDTFGQGMGSLQVL
jgi:hypothetical protein